MTKLPRHRRILVSAGTGYWWHFATEYLGILLASDDPRPESILASTGTRAAADEIRTRILQRLATAARGDSAGERERASLRAMFGLDASLVTPARCRALLQSVLVRLDHLRVGTLDSFVVRIACGTAWQLEVPVPLKLIDESDMSRLESEAVDAVIDSLSETVPELVVEMLDALTEGRPGCGVESQVRGVSAVLAALAEEVPESSWSWPLPEPPPEVDYVVLAERLEALAAEAEASKELGGKRVTNAIRTTIGLVAAIRDAQASGDGVPLDAWVTALGKGIVKPLAAGDGTFYKQPLHPRITAALGPMIRRFTWEIERIALRRTEALAALARLVRTEHTRLLTDRGEVTYDRITRAVGTHLAEHANLKVLERIDAKIDHLLVGEFQNTSRSQWEAIRPVASAIVACGDGSRSFVAIGDLKQSIHGWRGGDPEILENLGDRFDAGRGGVEFMDETLDLSPRSSVAVLDAVNTVFGAVAGNEVAERVSARASAWWGSVYATHHGHVDRPGLAELHLVEREVAEVGDEWEQGANLKRVAAAADLVAELRERHPHDRVGVVVRRNRVRDQICAALRSRGIVAAGSGSGSIRDSAAANTVLEFLRVCDQPDCTIAAFHVAHSPLGVAVGLRWPSTAEDRASVAEGWRRRMAESGIAAVLWHLQQSIEGQLVEFDRVCLRKLFGLARSIDRDGWTRPLEYVHRADRTPLRRPMPVTVLNIHQSKGLGFDSVICADLEFYMKPTPDVLVSRGVDGGIRRIVGRMRGLEYVPLLAQAKEETDDRQARESLCLLYVAMTRARDRLFMFVDAPKANEMTIPPTAAGLIRAALAPDAVEPGVVWRSGDPWSDTTADEPRATDVAEKTK